MACLDPHTQMLAAFTKVVNLRADIDKKLRNRLIHEATVNAAIYGESWMPTITDHAATMDVRLEHASLAFLENVFGADLMQADKAMYESFVHCAAARVAVLMP